MLTIQAKGRSINLDTGIFNLACSRTLRRMGQRIKTFSKNAITDRYNIAPGKVAAEMSLIPPSVTRLQTSLKISSKRMAVELFSPEYPRSKKGKREAQGVSVEIIKGERKIIRGLPVEGEGVTIGSFRAVIKAGRGVFVRLGHDTRKVREVTTIGVVDMFRGTVVQSQLDQFVDDTLPGELEHQVEFAITQQSGR